MPLDWLTSLVFRQAAGSDNEVIEAIQERVANDDARFARCVAIVLKHEGGFVDHPSDPGGATNYGISLRYARTRGSLFDLDGDGDVDKHDILLVKQDFAAAVYRQWFWADVQGDELPAGVDLCMFDYAVNSGASRPIRTAQNIVGTIVDGFIGPKTIAAINSYDPVRFVHQMQEQRLAFLRSIRNPKTGALQWDTFGRGWGRRVEEIKQDALAMIKP